MNEAVCAERKTLTSMLSQNRKEIKEIEATLNSLISVISREPSPTDGNAKTTEPSCVMEDVFMQGDDLKRISVQLHELAECIF